jgi:hypothetical protein
MWEVVVSTHGVQAYPLQNIDNSAPHSPVPTDERYHQVHAMNIQRVYGSRSHHRLQATQEECMCMTATSHTLEGRPGEGLALPSCARLSGWETARMCWHPPRHLPTPPDPCLVESRVIAPQSKARLQAWQRASRPAALSVPARRAAVSSLPQHQQYVGRCRPT